MRKTSLRELQHHMAEIMRWVDHGEEVAVTRRNLVIARLVPERLTEGVREWPDFVARARKIVGRGRGKPPSAIIRQNREERL